MMVKEYEYQTFKVSRVACFSIIAIMLLAISGCSKKVGDDDPDEQEHWSVGFLERPSSKSLRINGKSNVKISNLSFNNINGVAIVIQNCQNIEITECDFANVIGGIYVVDSKNVTITWNRFSNIGNGTIGGGHSDYIQFDNSFGGYIAYNKGKGGKTEDVISMYKSGGISVSDPLIIEYNHFEGDGWISRSGTGICLGDYGGGHIVARYNKLLSPGQVGIEIASGVDIRVTGNTIYSHQIPKSNVGICVWNQTNTPFDNIEVSGNNVRWYNENGYENYYWSGEDKGFIPKGLETNNWHSDIDPETLRVKL